MDSHVKAGHRYKFILFDCMETLVDLDPKPGPADYARWTYEGSGFEEAWSGLDEFTAAFETARSVAEGSGPARREHDFSDRLFIVCRDNPRLHELGAAPRSAAERLTRNFIKTYRARTYVSSDVHRAVPRLADRFNLGVVSNFQVRRGIEELLEEHSLKVFFKMIITSVVFGLRKPHPDVYRAAIRRCACAPDGILFVGDDPESDYRAPRRAGMHAVLLDRRGLHPAGYDRVRDFDELMHRLI
ncbi:MAG: HAD family hydrolase [Spirochaetales bacterium]|nr:HAD family hydrolase [Spirochaetales bacterium]